MARPGLHLVTACEQCGLAYRQSRSDQRFCSRICGARNWRATRGSARRTSTPKWSHEERRCKRCAKQFTSVSDQHVYCSDYCRQHNGRGKYWAKGIEYVPRRNCELCGKRFYATPHLVRRGGGRFCSNECRTKNMALHPENYPQTKGRRGNGGRRSDLENRYFRSSWEANYARYLNWLMERGEIRGWEYEPDTFEFPVKRGSRFYTPDFKVTETDGRVIYHEVKGYMDARSATKLKRMRLHHPQVHIVLVDASAYHEIGRQLASLIPNWELRRAGAAA